MNPDDKLTEIRHLARLVAFRPLDHCISEDDAERLARLVIDMDEWLSRNGQLPKSWNGDRSMNFGHSFGEHRR